MSEEEVKKVLMEYHSAVWDIMDLVRALEAKAYSLGLDVENDFDRLFGKEAA